MTESPVVISGSRPPRRRRRRPVLFIALLAGLALLAVWWTRRGTIDPRLVGRWENVVLGGLPGDMRFAADGNISYVTAYISLPLVTSAQWRVRGDELMLLYPERFDRQISWRAVRRNFDNLCAWVANGGPASARMKIVEITENTLVLELGEGWGPPDDRIARFRRVASEAEKRIPSLIR